MKLLSKPDCRPCTEVKNFLKIVGLSDKVEIIDTETPEGKKIAIQLGVMSSPVLVDGDELIYTKDKIIERLGTKM